MRSNRLTNRHHPVSVHAGSFASIARKRRGHRSPQVEALEGRMLLSGTPQMLVNYRTEGFYNAALGTLPNGESGEP